MILFIIFVITTLIGVACLVLFDNLDLDFISYEFDTFLIATGAIAAVFGAIAIFISLCIFVTVHCNENYEIEKAKIEYDGLVNRLEIINSEYEDVSKSDVVSDITEWNSKVYSRKYWTENKWTNWYNSKKYADSLNYIDLEE